MENGTSEAGSRKASSQLPDQVGLSLRCDIYRDGKRGRGEVRGGWAETPHFDRDLDLILSLLVMVQTHLVGTQ